MKLTESQIEIMKEDLFADIVSILIEKYKYTMNKAMEVFLQLKTFLQNPRYEHRLVLPKSWICIFVF